MNVKQFYIDVNGDYNDALRRMMNDVLIVRMIAKFMSGDSINSLVSLYENKDYRGVFASAHTLKGVAGNLSLTPLFEIACTITEATRNEDGVNLDKEIEELKSIKNTIEEAYKKHLLWSAKLWAISKLKA